MHTTDNHTYYKRYPPIKKEGIKQYVKSLNDINVVYDVGCNNGDISYCLQKELDIKVLGVDLSKSLIHPDDYVFKKLDIVNNEFVYHNDLTLFLSLYHHLLREYGLDIVDDIFLKLLLRTKYLIFDVGFTDFFQEEKKLLDHFNLKYVKIGEWHGRRGLRSIVVFDKKELEKSFIVKGIYKRKRNKFSKNSGLFDINSQEKNLADGVLFYKLEYNGKMFFAKKRKNKNREKLEMKNITKVYNILDNKQLIKYYGCSEKYGLIFEWLDDFEFVRKDILKTNNIVLNDVEIINIKGIEKIIDFDR